MLTWERLFKVSAGSLGASFSSHPQPRVQDPGNKPKFLLGVLLCRRNLGELNILEERDKELWETLPQVSGGGKKIEINYPDQLPEIHPRVRDLENRSTTPESGTLRTSQISGVIFL